MYRDVIASLRTTYGRYADEREAHDLGGQP
jgi:hypothetical protein